MLRSIAVTALTLFAVTSVSFAQDDDKDSGKQDKLEERAKSAAHVLANLVSDPQNKPPSGLLRAAVCIAVIPSVKEGAFIVGGKVGYGLASCRVGSGWSLPTYMSLKAGSVGFQAGGQASDVVLIFTHDDAPSLISKSGFEIGAGASVAAGPVGTSISANTEFKKGASIYSYSTKGAGLFAGVSVAGSSFKLDSKGNRTAYPSTVPTSADKSPDVAWLMKTAADAKNTPATVKSFTTALEQRLGSVR